MSARRIGAGATACAVLGALAVGAGAGSSRATPTVGAGSAPTPVSRQISVDPLTDTRGQHETAVEPDSVSFGNTVVATFQVGRVPSGGATGIGWATSTDGGATWRSGLLPALTVHTADGGSLARASDPAVAYDRVHGVWLISVLGIRELGSQLVSSLLISRSRDGISWSAPVATSPDNGTFRHDKNWIACDTWATSRFAGRCYVVWSSPFTGNSTRLAVSVSTDGGATWGEPTFVSAASGFGAQPLVRPEGTLVVVYAGPGIRAVRSTNGGRTFSRPVRVSNLRAAGTAGMRAPPFHTGEVDAGGGITLAWPDCRYRARCASNDIVFSSSRDGRVWTQPHRIPTGSLGGLQHVVPGLAVDRTTRGRRTRLALTFYALTPRGCSSTACAPAPYVVWSRDAGRSWTAPRQLVEAFPLTAYPQAGARFLGDYISTSFAAGGFAVPVFAAASAPFDGRFHQGVFASRIAPAPAAVPPLALAAVRRTHRLGSSTVTVSARVLHARSRASASCAARLGRFRVRVLAKDVVRGRARCTFRARAGRLVGSIAVRTAEADARRAFSLRIR